MKLLKKLTLILILLGIVFIALYEKDLTLEEAKAILADDESEFVEIDGMQVHYKREGKGFPIVLIHGTGAILQTWDKWTKELIGNDYEVIRMDVQSFGLTGPRKDEDYSIASYVNFMDKFIQKMDLDSFHLVGNSLGGKIAWQYAINNQDKIGKMILIAPSGFYTDDKESSLIFELGKRKTIAAIIKNMGTRFFVKNTLTDVYYNEDKIPEHLYDLYLAASKREGNRSAFLKRVSIEDRGTHTEKLNNISTPTLLMWGDHDVLVPHHLAGKFQERLPNDTLIVYPNVGHVPMEEIPLQSVRDALDFLK